MRNHDITRRNFNHRLMAAGSVLGVGGFVPVKSSTGMSRREKHTPVALQLYTVRALAGKDFVGTLKTVVAIGYDAVEFAGYGGLSAKDLKSIIDDLGLQCAGTHEGFEVLEKNLEKTIEFNAQIGNRNIVCPSMPGEWRRGGADSFRRFGERLNEIGEKVKKSGLQLCYHNHDFEFKKEGGEYLIDYMYGSTDSNLVKAEVDIYWVQRGGEDPIAFIQRYGDRCSIMHMKDMADDENKSFAPVGAGIMDMKGIIQAARKAGSEWYIVEQDSTKRPVLEAIEISLKNMRELLKV